MCLLGSGLGSGLGFGCLADVREGPVLLEKVRGVTVQGLRHGRERESVCVCVCACVGGWMGASACASVRLSTP